MKLWQKDNTTISEIIEEFTIGKDKDFDILLAKFDVEASVAHVKMLAVVGLITHADSILINDALEKIAQEIVKEEFKIPADAEDIHSYIEQLLTERIGEPGK